jgi:hypothetical protein
MTELFQDLTKALDAWKAVSLAIGQLRGEKVFELDEEWTSAMRAVILVIAKLRWRSCDGEVAMAKLQALGKGELEERLAQASRGRSCQKYTRVIAKPRYW